VEGKKKKGKKRMSATDQDRERLKKNSRGGGGVSWVGLAPWGTFGKKNRRPRMACFKNKSKHRRGGETHKFGVYVS